MGCHQWRVHDDEILPSVLKALVQEVEFNLLKTINSQPKEQTSSDSETLKKQAETLRRKIERGSKRYLNAPDELMAGLEPTLLAWKKELTEVENKILLVQIAKNQNAASTFREWWDRVKGKLVTVSDIEWGNPQTIREPIMLTRRDRRVIEKHIGGKVGSCRASWTGIPDTGFQLVLGEGHLIDLDADGQAWRTVELESPVKPAILAEPDALRGLLHDLKMKITLFWKRKNRRFFELDRRRLQAEINGHVLAAHTVTPGRGTKRWV